MKTKLIIGTLSFLFAFIGCTENNENPKDVSFESLELIKIDKGGCFVNNDLQLKSEELINDTLFYTVVNDSLFLTVDMINNCAACLVDSISSSDAAVKIFVENDCGPFANCICSFEYNFIFDNFVEKEILFSVYLKDFEEDEYTLWNELQYP